GGEGRLLKVVQVERRAEAGHRVVGDREVGVVDGRQRVVAARAVEIHHAGAGPVRDGEEVVRGPARQVDVLDAGEDGVTAGRPHQGRVGQREVGVGQGDDGVNSRPAVELDGRPGEAGDVEAVPAGRAV